MTIISINPFSCSGVTKIICHERLEQTIAYSPYSTIQVLVRSISLQDMMRSKFEALLQRKEIRDAYHLEFLVKKGVDVEITSERAKQVLKVIEDFTSYDYSVKLGSVLEADRRVYYRVSNFRILKEHLNLLTTVHRL